MGTTQSPPCLSQKAVLVKFYTVLKVNLSPMVRYIKKKKKRSNIKKQQNEILWKGFEENLGEMK